MAAAPATEERDCIGPGAAIETLVADAIATAQARMCSEAHRRQMLVRIAVGSG
jgi:hypothetical protein